MSPTGRSVQAKEIHKGLFHSLYFKISAFAVFFFVFCVNLALAGEVTLEWDRNSEPNIEQYWIFYGISPSAYTSHVEVGSEFTSCTISGLDEGVTYYFAAQAVNDEGVKSDYSNEVSSTIPSSDPDGGAVPEGDGGESYILQAYFDSGAEGFIYVDDVFRSTEEPDYARGQWGDTGGSGGGALQVTLGGTNEDDILGMSGGWERYFTLSQPADIEITFFYALTQTANYESDEYSQIMVSVDGILHGLEGKDYIDQITGNGEDGQAESTGWQSCTLNIGTLGAGEHSFIIGGYNNKKTAQVESTQVFIDDVMVWGGEAVEENSPPVSQDLSVSADENMDVSVTLRARDDDNDPLTYIIVNNPGHGRLSGMAPSLTYTPDTNYAGSDSFTFKAKDGTVESNVATVSITVNASPTIANSPPISQDQSVITDENTAVSINLSSYDNDGDPLSYTIMSEPVNGRVSGTAPNLTYTPNADYAGSDSFTFMANDGYDDSNVACVTITVNATTTTEEPSKPSIWKLFPSKSRRWWRR